MANPFVSSAPSMMSDYDSETQQIARQRKYAELLQQQAMKPDDPNQMVSGRVVAYSPLHGLAKMLQAYGSRQMMDEADKKQAGLVERQRADFSDTAQKYDAALRGTPAQMEHLPSEVAGPPREIAAAVHGSRDAALQVAMQSKSPLWQQMAMQQMFPKDPVVVGRSLVDPRSGQVVGVDQTWQSEQAAARQAKIEELRQKAEDARALQSERLQAQRELRQLTASLTASNKPTKWQTIQTPQGFARVNPETGETQPLLMGGQQIGTPKSQAKEQQDIQSSISTQQALDQAESLFKHPGRAMGTGASSWTSMIPGTDAKGFKANLDTFKAQTFVPMVSALKGMGALSDAEGKKLSDSIGALDPTMPEKEFEASLKSVTRTLYQKAKAAGLNVSLPGFAAEEKKTRNVTVDY